MVDDLDKTLEELFKRYLPQELIPNVAISFAAPDKDFPPSNVKAPAFDFFLYDIRENRDLRSNEWSRTKENGQVIEVPPPVRIDCSYLITAWASSSVPNPSQDEHRLLSEAIRVLIQFPTLPADVLRGNLTNQDYELPTSSLQPGRMQSLGEFWQAMGGKPKAALHYTVTISVPRVDSATSPEVQKKVIAVSLKDN
ncbi:MAG: DUF4255 domain-containing protein [Anaerolineaceae bacterium]|nr:DUF4255 domain-containing protein [Anaerolineaceae bacterium]